MVRSTYKSKKIFLDYAASVAPNPSSIHSVGVVAKEKLEDSRAKVARILSSSKDEIIFTSGGTESNNLAIQGIVHGKNKPHIVTTNIEHPSVLETFKALEKRNLAEISIVPVEANGIVDPNKIKKVLKKNTVLVSVMYANNEIGTIQPIREIAKVIRHFRKAKKMKFSQVLGFPGPQPRPDHSKTSLFSLSFPFFHTDAVQAPNYLDLNVLKLGVDMLSLSGSKIPGAGKIGVLYKKKNINLAPILFGGDQEMGFRPGTENLEAILKFTHALEAAQKIKDKEAKRLAELRDYFFKSLSKISNDILINGDLKNRLPNNINITFPKIPSDLLVIELSARGIMASSKSACKSSRAEGSYVIKAINPKIDQETGGVRFSLGKDTKKSDIDYTIKSLTQILQKLEKWYN